jgi:cobalt-zinc-cadmium efflux system membrane fusion protein
MLANAPNLFAPLFIVSDPTKLSVQLDVTELEMSSLKAGQKLRVSSRAYPGRLFEGHIEFIGDTLDPMTRTLKVRGVVDNHERLLKAEMYVSVDVEDDAKPAPVANPTSALVPGPTEISANAVFSLDQQQFVFVENPEGQYQRRPVHIAMEHHGKAIVSDGLSSGERIVSSGCLFLQSLTEGRKE